MSGPYEDAIVEEPPWTISIQPGVTFVALLELQTQFIVTKNIPQNNILMIVAGSTIIIAQIPPSEPHSNHTSDDIMRRMIGEANESYSRVRDTMFTLGAPEDEPYALVILRVHQDRDEVSMPRTVSIIDEELHPDYRDMLHVYGVEDIDSRDVAAPGSGYASCTGTMVVEGSSDVGPLGYRVAPHTIYVEDKDPFELAGYRSVRQVLRKFWHHPNDIRHISDLEGQQYLGEYNKHQRELEEK